MQSSSLELPIVEIAPTAVVGSRSKVWGNTKISDDVRIGSDCVIGRNVYLGPGVKIGNNCKIQNNAQIYEPAVLSDFVFIGPGVILTNDLNPRAVNRNLELKSSTDWEKQSVNIEQGASIGAGAVCIAPLRIGKWSLVGAGAVVTKNVADFALVVGNPARRVGWVGRAGFKLDFVGNNRYVCPKDGSLYIEKNNLLEALDFE